MARGRAAKQIKVNYDVGGMFMSIAGGSSAAMTWEGLDMIPALKDKPMVAPLITALLGTLLSGVQAIQPGAYGMTGASAAEITGQLVQKVRDNKEDDGSDKSVNGHQGLNGRLNAALKNPAFKKKFQHHIKNNPQFRDAIQRELAADKAEHATDVVKDNLHKTNEVFSLALEDAA